MAQALSDELAHLTNPLVSSEQLIKLRANDTDNGTSARFATHLLTQAAGVLLRLPQSVVATAIILLQRFQVSNGASTSTRPLPRHISAASIYLAAKNSFTPLGTRSIVNVYTYLLSKEASPLAFIRNQTVPANDPEPRTYYVSEGDYERSRNKILQHENLLLTGIGFDVHVALPYTFALTYISALGHSGNHVLATRTIEHLNGALLSPQWLYLTHQPNVLAVAAIYLAAREVGVKLVGSVNWWEVFDVDREGLGFCVMAMGSLKGFAEAEAEKWKEKKIDLG
jgi:cyclin L